MSESIRQENTENVQEAIGKEKLRGGLLMRHAQRKLHENIPKLKATLEAADKKLAELEASGKNKERAELLREIIDDAEHTLRHADRIAGGLTTAQEASVDSFQVHAMTIGTIISSHIALFGLLAKSPFAGGLAIATMTLVFGLVGFTKKIIDFDNVYGESGRAAMLTKELQSEIKK
jgi:hypothetical protein